MDQNQRQTWQPRRDYSSGSEGRPVRSFGAAQPQDASSVQQQQLVTQPSQPAAVLTPAPEQQIPMAEQAIVQSSTPVTQESPVEQQTTLPPAQPGDAPVNDFYAAGAKPGITIGVLAIITSLLIPPVGLVLGIVSFIKGISKQVASLIVMGIIGMLIGIGMLVVGILLLLPMLHADYLSGDLTTYRYIDKSISYTIDYPNELNRKWENQPVVAFAYGPEDNSLAPEPDASMLVMTGLNIQNLLKGKTAEQFTTEKVASAEYKQSIVDLFKVGDAKKRAQIDLSSFESCSFVELDADCWEAELHGTVDNEAVTGRLFVVLGKDSMYSIVAAADEDSWYYNEEVWQESLSTFRPDL